MIAAALTLLLLAPPQDAPPTGVPLAEGAALVKLCDGCAFTEGPAANARGDVYFTDQPNDRILRWRCASPDGLTGVLEVVLVGAGRANGTAFDAGGRLLTCADELSELRAVDVATGRQRVLAAGHDGARLNGPNDLWVHPSGAVYLTDPFYARPWWEHDVAPQPGPAVYRLPPPPVGAEAADVRQERGARRGLKRVATGFARPNGIVGTPDGATLYVADLVREVTWAFPIAADGALGERRAVVAQGSDGMALDEEGRLYLTGDGVTVVDPAAKVGARVLGRIDVPAPWAANVTFGGADRRTLFVTAGDGLYAVRMRVAGAATPAPEKR